VKFHKNFFLQFWTTEKEQTLLNKHKEPIVITNKVDILTLCTVNMHNAMLAYLKNGIDKQVGC
jgi:hypothetical protein